MVLLTALGLLLGAAGATAGSSQLPRAPQDLPEATIELRNDCVYVPQDVFGLTWFWYCPGAAKRSDFIRLRDKAFAPLHLSTGFLPDPASEDYFRVQAAQTAWFNKDCATQIYAPFHDICNEVRGQGVKLETMPKADGGKQYPADNETSFWEAGNNTLNVDDGPCEFMNGANKNKKVTGLCIDPRSKPPCPQELLGGPQGDLLRLCETQNRAVYEHFKYTQVTPGSRPCDTTGGSCTYDPGQLPPPPPEATSDESFLEGPIDWTSKRLREAVAQVSLWWIFAPEPMIDNGGNDGLNVQQNVNFLIRHTNAITLAIVALSIIIASIRISLTRETKHAKEVAHSIFVLVLVTGLSVLVINALVALGSGYSTWLLVRGLHPDANAPVDRLHGQEAATLAVESFTADLDRMNFFLLILLSICLIAGGLIQWVYMIARIPVVTILAGTLPMAAAAGNTAAGRSWLTNHITLLAAFVLVKPGSVTVFVVSARLFGSDKGDFSGPEAQFRGAVILLLMSLLLPALIKLIFPIVAPATGGQAASTTLVGGVLAGGARMIRR